MRPVNLEEEKKGSYVYDTVGRKGERNQDFQRNWGQEA